MQLAASFRSDDLELSVQANVYGTRTYHHFELSWFDYEAHAAIPQGKVVRPQHKLHCFRFARQQLNPLKAAQVLLVGCDTANQVSSIELHYFISRARSAVLHIDTDGYIALRILNQRTNAQVAIGESRIAQPMSEVVECTVHASRFALPLSVWLGGEVKGDLSDRSRNSDGQLSARIVITKQNVCDCGPCLRARKPGLENSRHVFVNPVDAHWPAINQDYYYGFAGSMHCLDQVQLVTRQIQTGARRAFADGLHGIAQHHYRQIGLFRGGDSSANLARFFTSPWFGQHFSLGPMSIGDLTAPGVVHFHAVAQLCPDPFQHRDALYT